MPESTPPLRSAPRASLLAAAALIGLGVTLASPGSARAQDGHEPHADPHASEAASGQVTPPRHGDAHGAGHGDDHSLGHAADPSAHFNWFDFGYADKDIYGGTLEPGEEPMPPPFALMLFNFGIVVLILMWKVRPAIRKYVAKRHDSIKDALAEASLLREQARAKLEEYTRQLARAEKEIEEMVTGIREGAEAEKKRILADAEAQAQALKRDAEQRIAAELERARAELEREVVAAAVAVAERLIREHATKNDHVTLADGFIQELESRPSPAGATPGAHR